MSLEVWVEETGVCVCGCVWVGEVRVMLKECGGDIEVGGEVVRVCGGGVG